MTNGSPRDLVGYNMTALDQNLEENVLELNVEVPFPTDREAKVAYEVLHVDGEPPRSQVLKSLFCKKNILNVCFKAPTPHQLRTGINGFLDNLILVSETMSCFGLPVSSWYQHN